MQIKWDGFDRGMPEWNKDLTMEEAFKVSCVPYYQEVARRIGKDTMQRWLDSLSYGTKKITSKIDTFWLDNSLKIKPDEQLGLVKKLYFEQLPFHKTAIQAVKNVMIQEQNANYTLAYKTGWGINEKGKSIGWLVGWIEEDKHPSFFVLNIEGEKNIDMVAIRKSILSNCLKDLGYMLGENFNGNKFALQALEQGASIAVVDEDVNSNDERLFKVDDVLTTLQALAKHHRQQFDIPFIAITGSNGKTTTKELVSTVLAAHYKTYTTQGNLNNHIGVPLTLLSIKQDAQMAVIEMGANHQKEIESYCQYTLPNYGLITNCGKAHLEGFGGVEGVKKGKGELFDFLRANNGTAFIYWDFDYLQQMSIGINNIVKYGTKEGVVVGNVKQSNPFLEVDVNGEIIKTNLVGDYNLSNVLTAVAIGKYFNVPAQKIKAAIESYVPSNSRSQLIEKDGNKIILDAYNANPSSMKLAIENFAKLEVSNKVLMLGAMMELGDESIAEHQAIIELIEKSKWKDVVLVGGDFAKVKHQFIYLNNSVEAATWYQQQQFVNANVLIKGSRSMQMEKVIA
ncbi:unnamed protein product [Rotaria sp. Silwood1]|nr:unnamed protein product [Rotaria sp. Silwood1]CAF4739593.1 unnamed protein product [Rotaria sp. Silwood1]